MFIEDKLQLQDFILRQLGSESHTVEVSDDNFDDIYNKSLKYLYERTNDSVNRRVVLIDLEGENKLTLNENVISINRLVTSSSNYDIPAYPGTSPIYDLLIGNMSSTSSYIVFNEQVKEIQHYFKEQIDWNFNQESKTITINSDSVKTVLMDYYETEDAEALYENELFLKLLERDAWKIWYRNTQGKYQGNTIGNGVILNGEYMQQEYERLDTEIKESVENEEYDFVAPIKIQNK